MKGLKLMTITALSLAGFSTYGQEALNGNALGGSSEDFYIRTRVDNDNNQIVAGTFSGTVELGMEGPSSTLTSVGSSDGYIAKYNEASEIDWAIAIEGTSQIQLIDCAIDNDNNIYVVGGFTGTADFDPSAGSENRTTVEPGSQEIFVAKYDEAGTLIWVNAYESGGYGDRATEVAVDEDGNCYVVGLFFGNIDMDPDGPDGLISSPMSDELAGFLLALDSDGGYINANKYWYANLSDIIVDEDGNIYVSGASHGTTDFDLAFGSTESFSPEGFQYGFVAKNTNDFDFEWVYIIDDESGDIHAVQEIAVNGDGDVYASGWFEGTVDFDPSAGTEELTEVGDWRDPFTVKLSADKSLEWVQSTAYIEEMHFDADDNIYSAGNFFGTVDFDAGPGEEIHTAPTVGYPGLRGGGFVQKMNEDGELLWLDVIQPAMSGFAGVTAIAMDNDENIYVSGRFKDSLYVNTSPATEIEGPGGFDVFAVKYGIDCDIDNSISVSGITLTVAETGATYQWLDCDDADAEIPGATDQSYTAIVNGNYSCRITTPDCEEISDCMAISTVGIEDDLTIDFAVYPNPTNGILNINTSEFVQSSLYDASGKLMLTTNEKEIDLSSFSSGLYILKASTSKGIVTKKIQLK